MGIARFKETEATISLHGLGFLQVKLDAKQRLHVWHPDLPRKRCFRDSDVHDHRFSFSSLILKGLQVNDVFAVFDPVGPESATHIAYLHQGPRTKVGNRPWIAREKLWLGHVSRQLVEAGEYYHMLSNVFHSTTPGGNGKVATLMTKTSETVDAARSLCTVGIKPEVDFDRFQMSEDDMWAVVRDVLAS